MGFALDGSRRAVLAKRQHRFVCTHLQIKKKKGKKRRKKRKKG
jgi:hypothetical protein